MRKILAVVTACAIFAGAAQAEEPAWPSSLDLSANVGDYDSLEGPLPCRNGSASFVVSVGKVPETFNDWRAAAIIAFQSGNETIKVTASQIFAPNTDDFYGFENQYGAGKTPTSRLMADGAFSKSRPLRFEVKWSDARTVSATINGALFQGLRYGTAKSRMQSDIIKMSFSVSGITAKFDHIVLECLSSPSQAVAGAGQTAHDRTSGACSESVLKCDPLSVIMTGTTPW